MQTTVDLNALVASIGDAVVVSDATGAITLWNPAAQRMFGHTEAQALGQNLDMIIPERLRKRHWDGYEKTMATGVTKYGHDVLRVPAINSQGEPMSIAFTVAMLYTPTHEVSAIVAIIRDETDRFNADRALKKRLADLEARVGGQS